MKTQYLHELREGDCIAINGGDDHTLEHSAGFVVAFAFGAGVTAMALPTLAVPLLASALAIGVTVLIWDSL